MPSLDELRAGLYPAYSNELAQAALQVANTLSNEIRLIDLGPHPYYQQSSPEVAKWGQFFSGLPKGTKSTITRLIRNVHRGGLETVGDLRSATVEELLELSWMKREGGIEISKLGATFLKAVFPVPQS